MNVNLHTLSLWAAIIGGAAAIYFPLHADNVAEKAAVDQQSKALTQQAVQRQRLLDEIYQRFGNDESAIAALASQLPRDKRAILSAIQAAQRQAQPSYAAQPAMVMFDKSMPKTELEAPMNDQIRLNRDGVAADAPKAERGPQ